jgi:N-acetylneuraminate synthase
MSFNKTIQIGKKTISEESKVYIIAEAGVNHNGDIRLAKQLIDIAAEAKADAVKFQAFKTESLILKKVKKAGYQTENTSGEESQFDMLKKLELSGKQNRELFEYCKEKEIEFLTTPFDEDSLDALDTLDLNAYKVASTDLTNLPFLEKIARKGKPVFLSTGMSYLSEVEMAVKTIQKHNNDLVLLQCSANYPIDDADANLKVINTYAKKFNLLLGYSDHSVGIGAAPYSVPMGVKVVEKHFTISKEKDGPDHKASLDPKELKAFVATIRQVESYMGNGIKSPSLEEQKNRKSLQKNLVALKVIKKGELITGENIVARRTGGEGISPVYFEKLIGKVASKDYNPNDLINE